MCKGIMHVHQQCQHSKKFEAVELCRQFSEVDGRCHNTLLVLHTVVIRAPALCIECFRRVENDIFKRCANNIKVVEEEIERITVALRGEMNAHAREELRTQRCGLVEELGNFKDARNEEIAEFRFVQGVWADG